MIASPRFLQIPLTDVLKRLAAVQGAGTTVVTPNRRLASALKRQFNEYQAAQKVVAWESADIIPFSVFIERLYLDALYSAADIEFPALLSASQTQVLWESVINDSDQGESLLATSQTAKLAYEAWQLAHVWELLPALSQFPLNKDGYVFNGWAQSYQQITKQNNQIDSVCLCDWLLLWYEQLPVKKPDTLICHGFEIFTPQQKSFLNVLSAANCDVRCTQPNVHNKSQNYSLKRVSYIHVQEEIYQTAVWARSIVEIDATAQIGIVVPTLSNHRDAIIRIFSDVMSPDIGAVLSDGVKPVLPFNVSLGVALTSYPLINALFQILALLSREVEYERVSRLLRSPFIQGGESEMSERAILDVQLRKKIEPVININWLISLIKRVNGGVCCPVLMQKLSELTDFRRADLSRAQKPSAMAKTITEILNIAGFPGERVLDSTEYQTLKKWHEVLANFSTLDRVISSISYSKAISRLYSLASETLFQPETPDVPIQILGVMEAAGMEFDHLWVMGLSDEVWPMHAKPNPFLPIDLQRQAKLPLGSSVESLNYSQQLTAGWLSCATEVVLSHPERSDDRDGHTLKPSALIKRVAIGELRLPIYASYFEQIQRASQLETIVDAKAPGLEKAATQNSVVSGGVAVIKDFAACPFRAMARHRLGIESLAVPHVGLNALERGMLIHDVLARSWEQLETKSALDDASDDKLEVIVMQAAEQAIYHLLKDRPSIHSVRFKSIEQKRLVGLALEWLEHEKKRGPFTVVAIEEKYVISIGGLQLNTRLDRVDQLDDGSMIIIDYKTQKQSIASLLGRRLDEPQLPLYLVTAKSDAVAVVFAQVKMGVIGFVGVVRDGELLPSVKAYNELNRYDLPDSWEALVKVWRQDLTHLATGFYNGDAKVDPKSALACRYCDLQPFCRIHERSGRREMPSVGDDDE